MRRKIEQLVTIVGVCLVGVGVLSGTASAQQTTTSTAKTQPFEVVAVDGNRLVVRGPDGAKEYTVPDDFRFTVDGQQLSVQQLKVGMKGTATVTTITTVKPVSVTEVRNGTVMQRSGNSIIVRTDDGIRMFSEVDVDRRGARLVRNGQPASITDFRAGDRLTATIVTEKPPQVMTEQQVNATLAPAAAAAAPAAGAARSAAERGSVWRSGRRSGWGDGPRSSAGVGRDDRCQAAAEDREPTAARRPFRRRVAGARRGPDADAAPRASLRTVTAS